MPVTLRTSDGQERSYDRHLGDLASAGLIPCFRCGVCCERWQPLITREEAETIAAHLGLPTEEFLSRYARPYPLREQAYIIGRNEKGCLFLRHDGGLAACAIHEFKPLACRDWQAALSRQECQEGLRRMGAAKPFLLPAEIYPQGENAPSLARAARQGGWSSFRGVETLSRAYGSVYVHLWI